MSTIHVSYLTRTYHNFLKSQETKYNADGIDMSIFDKVLQGKAATGNKSEADAAVAETDIISRDDMTMEEYKDYMRDRISQIRLHPTRSQETISVTISEEGFEAMKNNPEYEKWVLDELRSCWSQPDVWAGVCGGAYSIIYFGATKEEYSAQMWRKGDGIFKEKSKDSFWEKRIEKRKKLQEEYEAHREKVVIEQKYLDGLAKLRRSAEIQDMRRKGMDGMPTEDGDAAQAAVVFEAGLLLGEMPGAKV